jgi:Cu+-exporting ATPase
MGVTAAGPDGPLALGNAALMSDLGIALTAEAQALGEDETPIYLAENGAWAATFAAADALRPGAKAAIRALADLGLEIILASGDRPETARRIGAAAGIAESRGGMMPADKAGLVAALQGRGRVVAMAGDGVNDALALTRADIGIAMGSGAEAAREAAGVTLPASDLAAILRAIRLSKALRRNIRQNLGFAFGYNALGIFVAAGAIYPLTGALLSPMIAAAAMSLSSLSVITNALRLRRVAL